MRTFPVCIFVSEQGSRMRVHRPPSVVHGMQQPVQRSKIYEVIVTCAINTRRGWALKRGRETQRWRGSMLVSRDACSTAHGPSPDPWPADPRYLAQGALPGLPLLLPSPLLPRLRASASTSLDEPGLASASAGSASAGGRGQSCTAAGSPALPSAGSKKL